VCQLESIVIPRRRGQAVCDLKPVIIPRWGSQTVGDFKAVIIPRRWRKAMTNKDRRATRDNQERYGENADSAKNKCNAAKRNLHSNTPAPGTQLHEELRFVS
jgi:hypothetical protein